MCFIQFNISCVILSHSFAICMSFVCQSYVLSCHWYFICMSLLYACKSSVCTRTPFVCHSYLLVCRLYATRMYSYVIRMSLVCGFTMNYIKCFTENTKLWESLNIFLICDIFFQIVIGALPINILTYICLNYISSNSIEKSALIR